MEKLLLIIQSSPEKLANIPYDAKEKAEEVLIKALHATLNKHYIDNINLYIEIFIHLLDRILAKNPNDFNFIKKMYSEKNVISDYSFLDTFIGNICNNKEKINELYLKSIIDILEKLPKINKSNIWNIAIRRFCARIYTKICIYIRDILLNGANEESIALPERILEVCEKIIIDTIPNNLTEEEKKALIEILLSHAGLFCLLNDPQYNTILAMLDSLGVKKNDTRIKDLKRFKKNNAIINDSIPKKRT